MALTDIIGQDRAIKVLNRSIDTGRIAHAYIFDGIPGCGKKTTALAFIQAIFCAERRGCGQCPSCLKVSHLQHPDLLMVAPEGISIKIDQIRELQKNFSYHPYEAPKKACIIDEADKMNPASANALLKTLEEPPGNALLILLTSNLDAVLPTVRSRCQRLSFSPVPQDAMETFLAAKGFTLEQARLAASLSGGSIENALEIDRESLTEERRLLLERVMSLSLREIKTIFTASEELGKEKEKAIEFLQLLQAFFRDLLLIKGGCGLNDHDLLPLLQREGERLSLAQTMERVEWVTQTHKAVLRNVNPRLALDRLFIRLATG